MPQLNPRDLQLIVPQQTRLLGANHASFRACTMYMGSPLPPNRPFGPGLMSLASGGVKPPGTE